MQNSSYAALSRHFIELWQKQMSAVMNDREFIQAMLEMFHSMPADLSGNARGEHAGHNSHATDAPGANDERVAELEFRLRQCEQRLAALEAAGKRKRPASKPAGRRKSKPGAAAKRR